MWIVQHVAATQLRKEVPYILYVHHSSPPDTHSAASVFLFSLQSLVYSVRVNLHQKISLSACFRVFIVHCREAWWGQIGHDQ